MKAKIQINAGDRFGEWEITREAAKAPRGRQRFIARCPHIETIVYGDNLRSGRSQGCRRCGNKIHGLGRTPEYRVCYLAIRRCVDPSTNSFEHYGGKDVPVIVESIWYTPENLGIGAARMAQYVIDTIGRRENRRHQIDRIDTSRGYEFGNMKWSTPSENSRNRSDNRELTCGGITQCTAAWAEELGLGASTIWHRLNSGDPDWLALAPMQDYKRLKKEWKQAKREAATKTTLADTDTASTLPQLDISEDSAACAIGDAAGYQRGLRDGA